MSKTDHRFVFVVGPTASGKSDFALNAAETLGWPILNCDSVQVYREVNIGTAKPSPEDLARAPHWLFDYVEPPVKLSAADYLKDVSTCLSKNSISQGFFVGGSGFYVQALQKGLYPDSTTPFEVKEQVQLWIDEKGMASLYQWLKEKDPTYANQVSANDHYRIRRGVEVMLSQEQTVTELKSSMKEQNHSILPPHQAVKIAFYDEKTILRQRVEARTRRMLAASWLDEVARLREQGFSDWAPMMSVGYKEIQAHFDGELSANKLESRIVTSTMQLIKKQLTWFRRDSEIRWFKTSEQDKALDYIQACI